MALTKVTGQVIKNTTDVTVGVLTVTNTLAVGGTVSIGGTLTYEDVTNVDAVGLITARNGIVVGSGITLSKDGDVFFTGIATGNGSGLTALNATQLTSGTVPTARLGSGTASSSTFLRGDSTFQTVNTDLVSDTSPQLGGDLASNGNDIIFADNDKAIFGTGSDFKIYHNGTDNYIMASNGHIRFDTGSAELARITSDGKLLIGTTTEGEASADDLTIAGSGNQGITIRSGTSNYGLIYFSDATSGTGEYDGAIEYKHSDNFMVFRTGSSERLRIDSSGRVLVGHTGSLSEGTGFQVVNTSDNTAEFFAYAASTSGARLTLTKSRSGTKGTSTVVQSGDKLGEIHFRGADGTGYIRGATISAEVDGTPGTNDMPGRLIFSTTADGANSQTERLRIESDGDFRLSSDNAATNYAFIRGWQSSTGDMIIGADQSATGSSGSNLIFRTRGAEKARILNSGGITFNGDTAAANALDDYEEGSSQITVYNNSNLTLHSGYSTCDYTKVGNIVTMTMLLIVSSVSGSDYFFVNLPFTNRSESNPRRTDAIGVCMHNGINTGDAGMVAYLPGNTNVLRFYKVSDNAGWSIIDNGDLAVDDELYVTITYKTAT